MSLVGIELLTMDARIVIASVDTYLRFAEAVNRLDLTENGSKGLPELLGDVTQGAAKRKTAGAIDAVMERVGEVFSRDDTNTERSKPSRRRRPVRPSKPITQQLGGWLRLGWRQLALVASWVAANALVPPRRARMMPQVNIQMMPVRNPHAASDPSMVSLMSAIRPTRRPIQASQRGSTRRTNPTAAEATKAARAAAFLT